MRKRCTTAALLLAALAATHWAPAASAAAPRLDACVRVLADPDVAPGVADDCRRALAQAWPAMVAEAWPIDGARPRFEIRLMTTGGFRALHRDRIADWGVGLAEGERAWVDVERALGGGRNATHVTIHEAVHCLLHQALPGVSGVPAWFHEGLAQDLSGEWRFRDTVSLILDGHVPHLASLETGFPADPRRADQAYRTGLLAVQSLRAWHGRDAVPRLIAAARRTGDFRAAMREVTGDEPSAFRERFAGSVRLRFGWLVAATRWPTFFVLLAVLAAVGIAARRRRDRRRFAGLDDHAPRPVDTDAEDHSQEGRAGCEDPPGGRAGRVRGS